MRNVYLKCQLKLYFKCHTLSSLLAALFSNSVCSIFSFLQKVLTPLKETQAEFTKPKSIFEAYLESNSLSNFIHTVANCNVGYGMNVMTCNVSQTDTFIRMSLSTASHYKPYTGSYMLL